MIKRLAAVMLAGIIMFCGVSLAENTVEPTKPNTTIALVKEDEKPVSLFPYDAFFNENEKFMSSLIFDTLMELNNDGVPQKSMITENVMNEDYTSYKVTLRDDLFWHDAKPVKAEDIVFSYQYAKTANVPYLSHATSHDMQVVAIDDLTVEFKFAKSNPNYITEGFCFVPIISKSVYADGSRDKIVGSGGYKLKEQNEKGIVIEKTEKYFRNQLTNEIKVTYVPGMETATAGVRSGDYDSIMNSLYEDTKPLIKGKADLLSTDTDGLGTRIFVMNNSEAPFNDANVRKAISKAIDYKKLIEKAYNGKGKEGMPGFVSKMMPFATKDSKYQTNIDEAKKMLDDNGYKLEGEIRTTPAGKPMRFSTLVLNSEEEKLANKLAEQLKEIGIVLDVKIGTREQLNNRTFETAIMSLDVSYQWNEAGILALLGSNQTTQLNVAGYSNEEFIKLQQEYLGTISAEKRLVILHNLQYRVEEDQPIITLCYPGHTNLFNYANFDGFIQQFGTGIFFKGSFYTNPKTMAKDANKALVNTDPVYLNPFVIGGVIVGIMGITMVVWFFLLGKKSKNE